MYYMSYSIRCKHVQGDRGQRDYFQTFICYPKIRFHDKDFRFVDNSRLKIM